MKPVYLSKLVWLGLIQTLIGILTIILERMKQDIPWSPEGIIMVVIGILTMIIRIWFTDVPIGPSAGPDIQ